jgi:hypothetical protein
METIWKPAGSDSFDNCTSPLAGAASWSKRSSKSQIGKAAEQRPLATVLVLPMLAPKTRTACCEPRPVQQCSYVSLAGVNTWTLVVVHGMA